MTWQHELDLTPLAFEHLERAEYERRRIIAEHLTREDAARMNWLVKVQPMQNERCYLYRDHLVVSWGGWWTCVIPDKVIVRMQDGTLEGIMDQIDRAISRWLAKEAVLAVIAKQPDPIICPGCKNEIDPEVCHCGDEISKHNPHWCGHNPVPMGCTCGYAK